MGANMVRRLIEERP
ncbi:MAG: hypothetical protein M0C28_32550 [Candidatus Moduliflexus flocculans]|nr:hypothetical protein [Candidatus Moduliflexus flocculans]